jgi:UDP-N-acetylglucosamine 1-carboxyvinyltransferase
MESFLIKGGVPLHGEVEISGSKNAALPIMAAALLTDEPCVIRRVPDLSDTRFMAQILESLGAQVKFVDGTLTVRAQKIRGYADYELVLHRRTAAGPAEQGADFIARRLHHRRAAHQSAFERLRGARCKNQN